MLTAPAIKKDVGKDESELTEEESTEYRRVAARTNDLALDQADIQFAAKRACRGMLKPSDSRWEQQHRGRQKDCCLC